MHDEIKVEAFAEQEDLTFNELEARLRALIDRTVSAQVRVGDNDILSEGYGTLSYVEPLATALTPDERGFVLGEPGRWCVSVDETLMRSAVLHRPALDASFYIEVPLGSGVTLSIAPDWDTPR